MADQFHSIENGRKTNKYPQELAHVANISLLKRAIWEILWKHSVDEIWLWLYTKANFPDGNSHVCQQPIIVSKQLWWKSNINNHFCLLLAKKFIFSPSLCVFFFLSIIFKWNDAMLLLHQHHYLYHGSYFPLTIKLLNSALWNIMMQLILE